jgi:hypothetical protein
MQSNSCKLSKCSNKQHSYTMHFSIDYADIYML